jgi:hypothetical protein
MPPHFFVIPARSLVFQPFVLQDIYSLLQAVAFLLNSDSFFCSSICGVLVSLFFFNKSVLSAYSAGSSIVVLVQVDI